MTTQVGQYESDFQIDCNGLLIPASWIDGFHQKVVFVSLHERKPPYGSSSTSGSKPRRNMHFRHHAGKFLLGAHAEWRFWDGRQLQDIRTDLQNISTNRTSATVPRVWTPRIYWNSHFRTAATDWVRKEILHCDDAPNTSNLTKAILTSETAATHVANVFLDH